VAAVASPYRAATSIVTFTSEGSVSTGARRRSLGAPPPGSCPGRFRHGKRPADQARPSPRGPVQIE